MSLHRTLKKILCAGAAPRLVDVPKDLRKVERMTIEEAGLTGLMRRRLAGRPQGHDPHPTGHQILPER